METEMKRARTNENNAPGYPASHIRLTRIIRKTLESADVFHGVQKIVVGVSGGADSSVLLHLLCSLHRKGFPKPIAVHVHHGIRGAEADRDAEMSERLAHLLKCDFHLVRISPPKKSEHLLRSLRQQALLKVMNETGATRIILAHHQNDQAETFLYRLLTGTDLRGLRGMKVFRKPVWVRPMLNVSRKEIEEEAEACKIPYVQDSTNFVDIAQRNKIRNQLLPELKEKYNPKIVQHLAELSISFTEIARDLETRARRLLLQANRGEHAYAVAPFLKASSALRKYALQLAYEQIAGEGKALRRVQLKSVETLVLTEGERRKLDLPEGVVFIRVKDRMQWI